MTSEESEVTESVSEGMDPSSNPRRTRRRRQRRPQSRERPATATLAHPNILDESLKDKVDMTLTKKELLAAVKLCNDSTSFSTQSTRTASNLARLRKLRQYSSNDETGSSSGSAEQIYLPPKGRRSRLRTPGGRPSTSRLQRPTHSDLDIPNIRYYSKPRNVKARLSHKIKTDARRKMFSSPVFKSSVKEENNKEREGVQEPCLSCGRSDQPERFHTHPAVKKSVKSPLKEAKNNNNNNNNNEEKIKERRDNVVSRSQSPKKSVSPEKSLSASESSPQGRRRVERNGKENEEEKIRKKKEVKEVKEVKERRREGSYSPTKPTPGKGRPGRSREEVEKVKVGKDFTVDIFTVSPDQFNGETVKPEDSKEKTGEGSREGKNEKPSPPTVHTGRPTAVKCKVCGKEFGKASIKFHEPQCERKRQGEEERREKEKQAELQQEKSVSYIDHLENEGLNDSFDAIWEAHMQQLQPCSNCGRTFFPERLMIHERSCKTKVPRTADTVMNRRPRLGQISPVPEKPVRDIPVQYYISK